MRQRLAQEVVGVTGLRDHLEARSSPSSALRTHAGSSRCGAPRSMRDLLEVAERTRKIPMLLEDYLARETPSKLAG